MRYRFRIWVFKPLAAFGGAALLLLILELGVRVAMPRVNGQDTDRNLYREHAFGASVGWLPNAHGRSFGVDISTDDSGFRTMDAAADARDTWLFLSDSVTFGVGVPTDQSFAQLVQNRLEAGHEHDWGALGGASPACRSVAEVLIQHLQNP